jgi:hypothetical protein
MDGDWLPVYFVAMEATFVVVASIAAYIAANGTNGFSSFKYLDGCQIPLEETPGRH